MIVGPEIIKNNNSTRREAQESQTCQSIRILKLSGAKMLGQGQNKIGLSGPGRACTVVLISIVNNISF